MANRFAKLDAGIRARQTERRQREQEHAAASAAEHERTMQRAQARQKAITDFIQAVLDWQQQGGYTFGPGNEKLDFRAASSRWSARVWAERGEGGQDEFHTWLEVRVSEALNPEHPAHRADLGVLVEVVMIKHTGDRPDRDTGWYPTFSETSTFKRFIAEKDLAKVEDALLPMLESLIDYVNTPELEKAL